MAPMTGSITYADNQWLIFYGRFMQGFFSPWKPIHRIAGMLQQIRTAFVYKFIGV
jgi:hypothetical protein